MSIFPDLFSSPDERKVKRIFAEARVEAYRTTKPLGDLGLAVIRASHTCSETLKPMLKVTDGKEKVLVEMYVSYEFIYFFMHLTVRSASSQLTEKQVGRLRDYLIPLISSTAIDSYMIHWPENLKEKITSDFLTKLDDAGREYSTCKEFISKETHLTGNCLFSRLAENVVNLPGNRLNTETRMFIIGTALDAFKRMNLDTLVKRAGKVL